MLKNWDMNKIYSKIDSSKLILSFMKAEEITHKRIDMCPEEEYLQISGRKFKKGIKVDAHKHLQVLRNSNITQEAWVVLEGSIKSKFYDLDNSLLFELILNKGDVAILFRGGHSLEVLEENTIFYEFKNGPYLGQELDRTFIK